MGCGSSKRYIAPAMIGTGYTPTKVRTSEYHPKTLQWIVGDGKLLMFNKDNLTIEEVVVKLHS